MSWRPAAGIDVLKSRAQLLQALRAFFAARSVLEVETPLLGHAACTDAQIDSFCCALPGATGEYYLHASPELAMKRLLAAGSGSIYQVCKVFRAEEQGRWHNPEFTMLEWYRVGFDYHALAAETAELITTLLDPWRRLDPVAHFSYRELFVHYLELDPMNAGLQEIKRLVTAAGIDFDLDNCSSHELAVDTGLQLLQTHVIEPRLERNRLIRVYDFPPRQAALARLRHDKAGGMVAERFEYYLDGVELANGYQELTDPMEQQHRFEQEAARRHSLSKPELPVDERFLQAIGRGLPECAGVAVGLDRLLALALGCNSLEEVLAFPFDRA